MAVYAVGDIQGCFQPLQHGLREVNFNPENDTLWCCGDLVNRGPESLAVLRFLKSLGKACVCVLGNHDIQLLAYYAGGKKFTGDTLDEVLQAEDAQELMDWLRFQPLLHHDAAMDWCMVHAGLSPTWSLKKAQKRARRIQSMLQADDWRSYCKMLQTKNVAATEPFDRHERTIFAISVLTRMRFCSVDGVCDWKQKTAKSKDNRFKPWYMHEKSKWKKDCRVIFGHWAAQGLVSDRKDVLGLDSGCVWGGDLTLARIDTAAIELWSVPGNR